MTPNYTLRNDIVNNHSDRMACLKKYLPFFCLKELNLSLFKDGQYSCVDMGYVTMAVLRYLIEENHFNERNLGYAEIQSFIGKLLSQDFELTMSKEEEKEVSDYIFDKIKNDGKPFTMDYFDPADKKTRTLRVRLVEANLIDGAVSYSITADAIEFYLATKEAQEESKINIQQLLLEKMIASRNFRGGIEVVRRINSEVMRLRVRKQEVIRLLGLNVFEGVKALEEFQKTGMRWFSEEQRAFERNRGLIEQALTMAQSLPKEEAARSLKEIFELETEIKKAMGNHQQLLSDCMDLVQKSDEIIRKYKYSRLRNAFDFNAYLEKAKQLNDVSLLAPIVMPLNHLYLRKTFAIGNIDELLTYPGMKEEVGEKVTEKVEKAYQFDDELEDERISANYYAILRVMLSMLSQAKTFTLKELNEELLVTFFDDIFHNSDYYSFLVHICQKKSYDLAKVAVSQDTFFDSILAKFLAEPENERYRFLSFHLELGSDLENYEEVLLEERFEEADDQAKIDGSEEISHKIIGYGKESRYLTSNIRFIRDEMN